MSFGVTVADFGEEQGERYVLLEYCVGSAVGVQYYMWEMKYVHQWKYYAVCNEAVGVVDCGGDEMLTLMVE